MSASHQAQVPAYVRAYFGDGCTQRDTHPVITSVFRSGPGWTTTGYRKRVSASWLRRLKREGVTAVVLTSGGRSADFGVEEILAYSAKLARQPLLGGSLIG